ncbi:MAG: protein kinase, partial [Anaerolineae bacterium]
MPLEPDKTILNGKYHIERLLDEGGMARVWLAEEPKLRRQVAIKEPKSGLTNDQQEALRLRFQREQQVAGALNDLHIVRVLTTEAWEGTELLVMEYMAGGNLAERIAQNPTGMEVADAVAIARAILQAVKAVHA